jgi:predicted DNA-binding ribbon-helix-helix protein
MLKKNKVIQIRISESDRNLINNIYESIEDFNLSSFLRDSLRKFGKERGISSKKGIGNFTIN